MKAAITDAKVFDYGRSVLIKWVDDAGCPHTHRVEIADLIGAKP